MQTYSLAKIPTTHRREGIQIRGVAPRLFARFGRFRPSTSPRGGCVRFGRVRPQPSTGEMGGRATAGRDGIRSGGIARGKVVRQRVETRVETHDGDRGVCKALHGVNSIHSRYASIVSSDQWWGYGNRARRVARRLSRNSSVGNFSPFNRRATSKLRRTLSIDIRIHPRPTPNFCDNRGRRARSIDPTD